jgi:hypothetical protein
MLEDGLRPRSKGVASGTGGITGIPDDIEGGTGSPRKHHVLSYLGTPSDPHKVKRCWFLFYMNLGSLNVSCQELDGPFFKVLTNFLLIGGAISSLVLFFLSGSS